MKLIELSMRGTQYYYLNDIGDEMLTILKEYASKFYKEKSIQGDATDDEIVAQFVAAVQKELHISLNNIPVATVLVIK